MKWLVLCIVGSVREQNRIVKNDCVDDWTAELATIASNIFFVRCAVIRFGRLDKVQTRCIFDRQ